MSSSSFEELASGDEERFKKQEKADDARASHHDNDFEPRSGDINVTCHDHDLRPRAAKRRA